MEQDFASRYTKVLRLLLYGGSMRKIIFDMGNTLIDFHQGEYSDDEKDQIGIGHLSELLNEKYSVAITVEQLNELFLNKWLGDFYKRAELKELDFQAYLNKALESLGVDPNNLDSLECMRAYYFQYMKDAVLNKNVKQVLKRLKHSGFTIHVLSNCILSEEIYIEVFKALEINEYIEKYTFSYNAGARKPDLSLFQRELVGHHEQRDRVYFVGDNLKVDILPAVEVGMTGIWYNRLSKKNSIMGNYIEISDFSDLEEVLDNN